MHVLGPRLLDLTVLSSDPNPHCLPVLFSDSMHDAVAQHCFSFLFTCDQQQEGTCYLHCAGFLQACGRISLVSFLFKVGPFVVYTFLELMFTRRKCLPMNTSKASRPFWKKETPFVFQ